ncbi:MAG: c-type cytochrome [Halothiobacillus sp.]
MITNNNFTIKALCISLIIVIPITCSASANQIEAMGKQIAEHGSNAIPACAICHGAQGEGNLKAGYPKLASVGAQYLQEQMNLYASGQRTNTIMQQYAAALTTQQRMAVTTYYADLPARDLKPKDLGGVRVTQLLENGDPARGLPSCFSCHGDHGEGSGSNFPPIAGEPALYFIDQMNAWRTRARPVAEGDPMAIIAKTLNQAEIINLAHALE